MSQRELRAHPNVSLRARHFGHSATRASSSVPETRSGQPGAARVAAQEPRDAVAGHVGKGDGDRLAAAADLEVEMRAEAVADVAALADDVSLGNALADM